MRHDEFWRAYTLDKKEAMQNKAKDPRPIHFVKNEFLKKKFLKEGRRSYFFSQSNNRYYLSASYWQNNWNHKEDNIFEAPTLYNYQEHSVEEVYSRYSLWCRCALVYAPTGAGKTFIMLWVIQRLRLKAVVVVPNVAIWWQLLEEYSKFTDTKLQKWSKKIELWNITIMTHQTFNRIYDDINWKIWLLVVDEWHHYPETRQKQVNEWKWDFIFFTTATVKRKEFYVDWFVECFWSIIEVPITQTLKDKVLPMDVHVYRHRSHYSAMDIYNAQKWLKPWSPELYRRLVVNDDERTKILAKIIQKYQKDWYNDFLVLTDRVEHVHRIYDELVKLGVSTYKFYSDTEKDITREQYNKTWGIIVGNIQCCWEWFNVPRLEVAILFVSSRWSNTIDQAAGRVRRAYGEKTKWIFIDFADLVSWLKSWRTKDLWFYDRRKMYLQFWWNIQNIVL